MLYKYSKKGQMQNQLFSYILTIVIIGLLLFFSIKWLGGLMGTSNQMDVTRFKSQLESSFEAIAPNYGSYEYKRFNIPSSINRVCFVDPGRYSPGSGLCTEGGPEYDPFICDAWETGGSNVLFEPVVESEVKLPSLELPSSGPGYECFPSTDGYIKVRLEGRGNKVKISR